MSEAVTVPCLIEREFATGDRIQFTAPDKNLGVANRDLGTVTGLNRIAYEIIHHLSDFTLEANNWS